VIMRPCRNLLESEPDMNILLTSAGRRTSLLRAFKSAVELSGGCVIAGDMDGLAPALFLADKAFPLPPIKGEFYLDRLLAIVEQEKIGLLVPTIDTELSVLAENAPRFSSIGCKAVISSPEVIKITGDKWNTVSFFKKNGVDVPASWLPEALVEKELPGELFIKPRNGSASQNTYKAERSNLADLIARVPDPIIQEELFGPEVTVDALLDFNGKLIHYVPRQRIKTLAGESIQGQTIDDRPIRSWLCQVFSTLGKVGAQGPITLQFFQTERGPVLTEINPRFGGGFPLAYAAGGQYPQWLVAMASGEKVEARVGEYKVGLYMTRHHVEIFSEAKAF